MARGLVLFVHGLGGSARSTWGDFPKYLAGDSALKDYDIAFFEYPTALVRLPFSKKGATIQVLAQALRTTIENTYPSHRPVVLVGHSLGGLIARQYILSEVIGGSPLRVEKLLLYAVPNEGAGLAEVARYIGWRNGQLRQLCRSADLIELLNNNWTGAKVGDQLQIRYVVAAQDRVVSKQSAEALRGVATVEVLADRDHRSCVKPRSADDLVFAILRNFVLETPGHPADRREPKERQFRVIGFDLDGTLLRGLTFSWTLVWKHLGYHRSVYEEGMRRYLQDETSYEDWCKWAVQKFRAKDLRRSQLQELAAELTLTNNLEKAVIRLKELGFVTGIISGGIDVFLDEKLPNAAELFDYIFINKLRFDPDGLIADVDPTPYDFAGKADALELMATNHGHTLAECIFVGEGFNDAEVARRAGLSIAYPPRDFGAAAAADIQIPQDDLMRVLEAVLV